MIPVPVFWQPAGKIGMAMHPHSLLYLLVLFSARCQDPISWRCANRPKWNVILQTELVEPNVCPRVTSSRFDGMRLS